MKRIYSYIAIASMLAAASCTVDVTDPGLGEVSGEGLILTISCADAETRAEKDGEDAYNENRIDKIDYFLYPSSGVDGEAPVHGTIEPKVVGRYVTSIAMSASDVEKLFPGAATTCQALVVVNYYGDYASTKVADILATKLPAADFISSVAQERFVMISKNDAGQAGTVPITLESKKKTTVAHGEVKVRRVASKMTVAIHVNKEASRTKTIDLGSKRTEVYEETWVPDTNNIEIALKNVNKYAVLDGTPTITPLSTADTVKASLVSYPYTHDGGRKMTGGKESAKYYDYELGADGNYSSVEKTGTFTVSEPFYSYPWKWAYKRGNEPSYKIKLPWTRKAGVSTIVDSTANTTTEGNNFGELTKVYYYKFNPAFIFKGDTVSIGSNYWYKFFVYIGILGNENEGGAVSVTGTYYVVDWKDAAKDVQITTIRYLNVFEKHKVTYNSEKESISYKTSDPCEIANLTVSHPDFSKNTESVEYEVQNSSNASTISRYLTLETDANGNPVIHFHHALKAMTTGSTDYDVAPYTITFTIRHSDDHRYSETLTIVQYPSIIITLPSTGRTTTSQNDETFVNGFKKGNDAYDYMYNEWDYNNSLGSVVSVLDEVTGNGNPNMYIIKTTVLDESSAYMLGDPRSTTKDNDLGNSSSSNGSWSASATSVQGGNRRISYYHPTIEDGPADNIIAPEFRIASSFGATSPLSYQGAKERCASYQEFGYPAGRWRLMTFAEASYIARLSSDGKIPTLLSKGSQYWTAGGYVTISNSGAPMLSHEKSGSYYVRCVYDEWYWKNTEHPTVSTTTFTWGDTNE
ncbi:MAG: hypothetical protein LKK16_00725 [Bacteroidales bacterium]|jgi:hypothetical protein|nr:hypothetical protein [Bacteroidales bacterium]MCI2134837.1 hypothetical protein [Bacteroidales bacterium]